MHPVKETLKILSDGLRLGRQRYHLSLGELIDRLKKMPEDRPVICDTGQHPGKFMSYRGCYEDLAVEPTDEKITAGKLLNHAEQALGNTFEGYKGGSYTMTEDTPLWLAPYGNTGPAIIGMSVSDVDAVLQTMEVE